MDQHTLTVPDLAMRSEHLAEENARSVKCLEKRMCVWLFPEPYDYLQHPQWFVGGTRKVSGFCSPGFQSSCTPMLTLRLSPPETPRRYSLPTLVFAHCRKRSSAITSSTWGDPNGNRDKTVSWHVSAQIKPKTIVDVVKIHLDTMVLFDREPVENKSWF